MVLQKPFGRTRRLYFVGIGGIGMSALAKLVGSMGYKVCGSDLRSSENTKDLEKFAIEVFIGHKKEHLTARNDVDVVVTSSAISPANPEILAAQDMHIPIITRGELLAEVMRLKEGIAIAGTHGKTTTTALVSAVFHEAGFSPTAVIGGRWSGIHSNSHLGESDIMICETDESDGSFLKLSPVFVIVTNIDLDHMDYYRNEEQLILHFLEFINRIPFYGKAFLCLDDQRLAGLRKDVRKPYVTYGLLPSTGLASVQADLQGQILALARHSSQFTVTAYGKTLGTFTLNMPGRHNVLNVLPAIGLALEAGIALADIKRALAQFKGIERRLSTIGTWRQLTLMDDYGHHPTEIRVTLATLKTLYPKIIVAFQPHRYTRTLEHYKAFAHELACADKVYLTPIYPAGEDPIENVHSSMIANELQANCPHKPVHLVDDLDKLVPLITHEERTTTGLFITIGAGNIYTVAKQLSTLD